MESPQDHAPPKHWQDFEDLCLRLWRPRLIDAKKHGRTGQPQAGVDIFGRDPNTEGWVGIQCKQKGQWPPQVLTIRQIEEEIGEAAGFEPPLSHFVVATTARRDVTTQAHVRKLSEQRRDAGQFTVDLFAWDDLQEWLHEGTESTQPSEALLEVWLNRVARTHRYLMPYFDRRGAPLLEHVYVELQLSPQQRHRPAEVLLEDLAGERLPGQPLSIRQVLDLDPRKHPWVTRRWLLKGDPGSGKTTLLRHLARSLAKAGGVPWVPVFESLPRLLRDERWLFDRIEQDLGRVGHPGAGIRQALEDRAEAGGLVLLLDGLDEVPRELRHAAGELLGDLAEKWPRSPIVVTTRPIGAGELGPAYYEVEVLPFDDERRQSFLAQWFGGEGEPDLERAAAVAEPLKADRNLRELTSNPLYLTLIALLVEEGDEPARHRPRLFEQIFELLEEGRHHQPPEPIRARKVAHEGLRHLAFQLTEANLDAEDPAALDKRLLEDERVHRLLKREWGHLREYLNDVAEKTGILGPHDGPEADWRFWHRTFREGLTAEELAAFYEKGGKEALCEKAKGLEGDLSRWAEPYALAAGRVPKPDRLVLALIEANRELGLRAVTTAQGLHEETLRQVLALSEGRGNWEERQKVFERLPELIDDPLRVLALIDQLRQTTRNGNDLFFLEQAAVAAGEKRPEGQRAAGQLRKHFYDHIRPPPEELFGWIDTPHDGRVELWCEIPAGRFLMGSPPKEEGRFDVEGPQHEVRIGSPFWMAAVPVTVAQYAAFDPDHRSYHQVRLPEDLEYHPVENVTWYQAWAFCRWLSASLAGLRGARLPTEEEWEYACRAGTQTRYSSGNDEADLARVSWYDENSGNRTHPVGEKLANGHGLYDMHGHVWEWTHSPWTNDYSGRKSGIGINPSAVDPADLAEGGGGFGNSARICRSAYRGRRGPTLEIGDLGFRVLLPSAPSRPSTRDL